MHKSLPKIVIIGGGFGGLYAARTLKRAKAHITLIDRKNHHLFQPLLYQVATAGLSPSNIASPIRAIVRRQKNITTILGEALAVNTAEKKVILADKEFRYDYLIIATGATHSYFGHDEWAKHAPGLKSVEDALEMRRRILLAFEAAERETDPELRAQHLTFVVVGAGPTGVELAGALIEISRHTLTQDFRSIDPKRAQVLLLEGLPRVLPTYPEDLSEKAREQLTRLGAQVHTNTQVTAIDENGVVIGDKRINSKTVLWAAGVQASPLAKSLGVPLDKAGRVLINIDLSVPNYPEIFVIGDLAALHENGKTVPGVAPAAIQEGKHAAKNILRALRQESYKNFHYRDKGSLATIGRAAAVAQIGKLHLSGFIAWWAWLFIHIFFLIGFRNRLFVLIEWAWAYITYQRGARLITEGFSFQQEKNKKNRT